ncbi:MAG: hypothetical protein WBS20_02490 [Lysobacterales bacterium]
MFRYLRIAILLTILAIVAGNQWLTGKRLNSWTKPLWITIYPVLADPGPDIRRYAESIDAGSFQEIDDFLTQQAARYGQPLAKAAIFQVARPLTALPPALPVEYSGLKVALWSLEMRWWSWRNGAQDGLAPGDIRMFVIYQKADPNGPLERSVGVRKGGYGVVNAVASSQRAARNRIIITHELLHVLGATDKYDLHSGQPLAPDGLADPQQVPLYPQHRAEIMGGRIADSANRWVYPASLRFCVIGPGTAAEIGW